MPKMERRYRRDDDEIAATDDDDNDASQMQRPRIQNGSFFDENEKVTNTWECIARAHTHEPIFIFFFSSQSWRQVDHAPGDNNKTNKKRRKTKSISGEMCTVLFKENLIWDVVRSVRGISG